MHYGCGCAPREDPISARPQPLFVHVIVLHGRQLLRCQPSTTARARRYHTDAHEHCLQDNGAIHTQPSPLVWQKSHLKMAGGSLCACLIVKQPPPTAALRHHAQLSECSLHSPSLGYRHPGAAGGGGSSLHVYPSAEAGAQLATCHEAVGCTPCSIGHHRCIRCRLDVRAPPSARPGQRHWSTAP